MVKNRPVGYRNYTKDGRYWTVRKTGRVYWVVKIEPVGGEYIWHDVWGGYYQAGSAGGAAAQLAYADGKNDAVDSLRKTLHKSLDRVGLGAVKPAPPAVKADTAPKREPADDAE